MKKFLLFLVVAVSAISMGLTIYYFSADNEVIHINSSYLVVDRGESIPTDNLLSFKNRDEHTTLKFGVGGDANTLSFSEDGYYVANNGGNGQIVITTSNNQYSRLVINVLVCDGSEAYPYVISSEDDLKRVGKDDTYTSQSHYILGADITLEEAEGGNFVPIPDFYGVIDGKHHVISNIDIMSSASYYPNICGFVSVLNLHGVIKNITFDNMRIDIDDVSSVRIIGGVAGISYGLIQATELRGQIDFNGNEEVLIGGIAGENNEGTIDRCGFEGGIAFLNGNDSQCGGGIAGKNEYGRISESYFRSTKTRTVINNGAKFAGIVYTNEGLVEAGGSKKLAHLYDNYFYLEDTSVSGVKHENIYGLIGKDVVNNQHDSSHQDNVIMGNYYSDRDGATSFSGLYLTADSYIDASNNGFLPRNKFRRDESSFVTAILKNGKNYLWNFDEVWILGGSDPYPVLNPNFPAHSIYTGLTPDNIVDASEIISIQDLYTSVTTRSDGEFKVIGTNGVIDCEGFVWGDEAHPIPESFSGTLIGQDDCKIKNLKIQQTNAGDVGLFLRLDSGAKIKDLMFNGVTILGSGIQADNVGVIAGENVGGLISGVCLSNVTFQNVKAENAGAVVGKNSARSDDENISGVKVDDFSTDGSSNVIVNCGAIAGLNDGFITKCVNKRNTVNNAHIQGINNMGGVVGKNETGSIIEYVDVTSYKVIQSSFISTYKVISAGGVAGLNYGGVIFAKVVSPDINMQTIEGKKLLSLGGAVGTNYGSISHTFVHNISIVTQGNFSCYAGGIAGQNGSKDFESLSSAEIVGCGVQDGGSIKTYSSLPNSGKITKIDDGSTVGGIAGVDALTSMQFSIKQSFVKLESISGRLAGGLAGVIESSVSRCYCGTEDSGVKILGVITGGLCALTLNNANLRDCYTICDLIGKFEGEGSNDAASIIGMKSSFKAGLVCVMGTSASDMRGCYCVVKNFGGYGFNYSVVAYDVENNPEMLKNCLYENDIESSPALGTYISKENLLGKGNSAFQYFVDNIGSDDPISVWKLNRNNYPTLVDMVNVNDK